MLGSLEQKQSVSQTRGCRLERRPQGTVTGRPQPGLPCTAVPALSASPVHISTTCTGFPIVVFLDTPCGTELRRICCGTSRPGTWSRGTASGSASQMHLELKTVSARVAKREAQEMKGRSFASPRACRVTYHLSVEGGGDLNGHRRARAVRSCEGRRTSH